MKIPKLLLLLACLVMMPLSSLAQNGFYEFDSVLPKTILELFLEAKKEGRKYPTDQQFIDAGITLADLEFIRSHVKRHEIAKPEDRLIPSIYEHRRLFMCTPMGNGLHGYHGYPSNEMGHTDVFSMWNYTEAFGSWNHGFFQAPGSWVDAAHKNGSRIMSGQMFFESTFGGADDSDWIKFISTRDENGYVYVEPMINALMYFGSDGIVYNWEASGYRNNHVIAFHKELYKLAKERNFLDYNSLIYTNESSLSMNNYDYLYGTKENPVHECFLNYHGGDIASSIVSSQSYAEKHCGGVDGLYAGVHILHMGRSWSRLAQPGAERIGLIVWGEHQCTHLYDKAQGATDQKWQLDYQLMQEHFFSGGNGNPANRPSLANSNSASYADKMASFCGMAEFFPERSTIHGKQPFLTHFNLGNGEFYYHNGAKMTKGGWYNMAAQDLVPTYRWLVYNAGTTTVNTLMKPAFHHGDAYVGGSCLRLSGNVGTTGADVILYKTDMQLANAPIAKVAVKNISGNGSLSLLLRINGEWKELPIETISSSWHEYELPLDNLDNGVIERIALRIKGNAELLVGKIELNDNSVVTPKPIKKILSAETISEKIDNVTLKLHWQVDADVDEYGRSFNETNNIDHFEIVCKSETGTDIMEVGRTSQWATIASQIPFAPDAETLEVGVRSVSTDLKTQSPIVWTTIKKGTPDEVVDPADISGQDGIYDVNFNEKTAHTREDRYMMHIGLYDEYNNLQKYPNNNTQSRITKQLYLDATEKAIFDVVAGETYTPYIDYSALWMSGYAFVDWDNSGDFDEKTGISFAPNGKPSRTDMCEVVSFSSYNNVDDDYSWYKSDGTRFNKSQFPIPNNIKMGAFRVPNVEPGIYRMRFKLDWNSLDPGGNKSPKNLIYNNGGDIIDVLLNVHAENVKIGAKTKDGEVSKGTTVLTEEMNGTAEFKKDLQLTFKPAEGFKLAGATIRHGYNLKNEKEYNGEGQYSLVHNRQWWEEKIEFNDENYTLPARLINGDVLITPIFENTTGIEKVLVTEDMMLKNDIYNLNGQLVRRGGSNAKLAAGVYVMKGYKIIVK